MLHGGGAQAVRRFKISRESKKVPPLRILGSFFKFVCFLSNFVGNASGYSVCVCVCAGGGVGVIPVDNKSSWNIKLTGVGAKPGQS